MVCNLKPGGKGIEVKQFVQMPLTRDGRQSVAWNRYKKAVRSDYHQAMLYYKAKTKHHRFALCWAWMDATPTAWNYLIPGEHLQIPYDLWVHTSEKRLREWTNV